mgnify:CR=1 FL=1
MKQNVDFETDSHWVIRKSWDSAVVACATHATEMFLTFGPLMQKKLAQRLRGAARLQKVHTRVPTILHKLAIGAFVDYQIKDVRDSLNYRISSAVCFFIF